MTHSDLIEIGCKWLLKRCGVVIKDLRTINTETPDLIGFRQGESFLIECKTSRGDFINDKRKQFRKYPKMGMGKFRYYLCPEFVIRISELPDKWGLIYVNKKGKARCVHNPFGKGNIYVNMNSNERNKDAEMNVMYSVLRRLQIKGLIDKIYF